MNISTLNFGLIRKIALSVFILGVLAFSMDYSKFNTSIGKIHIGSWLVALTFIYIQILALSYRWLNLINVHSQKITFSYAIKVNLASLIANYLFITSVGGIIVRITMSVKSGVSFIRSVAATILDRFFTLFALFVLAVIFLPIFNKIVKIDLYHNVIFLMLILFGSTIVFSFLLFEGPRKKIIFSHRKIAMCFQYLRTVFTNQEVLGKVMLSSVIGQLSYFAAVYCIITSMGLSFSWLSFIAVIPVITIVASLPVGYGGWGIREGAFIFGLGLIDIPFETAFSASIQIGIISMGAAIIAGVPVLLSSDFRQVLFHKKDSKTDG